MNLPPENQKTEFAKLPLRIDKQWLARITEKGKRIVLSRNAAVCLCIKIGAPILDHIISLMEKAVQDQCGNLENQLQALSTLSPILPLPALPNIPQLLAHEQRNRANRAGTATAKASSAKGRATGKPRSSKKGKR